MLFLKTETKPDISNENSKIERVNVRLCQQISGAKASQMGMVTEFVKHKKEVAYSLGTIRSEPAEIRNEMLIENISLLNDTLDAAGRDSASRFGEQNSSLDTLEEQVTVAGRVVTQHSMGNKQKDVENSVQVEHSVTRLIKNGSRHSDGQMETEVENDHERAKLTL
jgi:hypothetical protein